AWPRPDCLVGGGWTASLRWRLSRSLSKKLVLPFLVSLALPAAMRSCALAFVTRKEAANNDDVSDVGDGDLVCSWYSTYYSADRSHRETAEKMTLHTKDCGRMQFFEKTEANEGPRRISPTK